MRILLLILVVCLSLLNISCTMPVRIVMDKTDNSQVGGITPQEWKIINSFPDNSKFDGCNWQNLLVAIHKKGGDIFSFGKYMNDYFNIQNPLTADFDSFLCYLKWKLPISDWNIDNWWNEVMSNYKLLEKVK